MSRVDTNISYVLTKTLEKWAIKNNFLIVSDVKDKSMAFPPMCCTVDTNTHYITFLKVLNTDGREYEITFEMTKDLDKKESKVAIIDTEGQFSNLYFIGTAYETGRLLNDVAYWLKVHTSYEPLLTTFESISTECNNKKVIDYFEQVERKYNVEYFTDTLEKFFIDNTEQSFKDEDFITIFDKKTNLQLMIIEKHIYDREKCFKILYRTSLTEKLLDHAKSMCVDDMTYVRLHKFILSLPSLIDAAENELNSAIAELIILSDYLA